MSVMISNSTFLMSEFNWCNHIQKIIIVQICWLKKVYLGSSFLLWVEPPFFIVSQILANARVVVNYFVKKEKEKKRKKNTPKLWNLLGKLFHLMINRTDQQNLLFY